MTATIRVGLSTKIDFFIQKHNISNRFRLAKNHDQYLNLPVGINVMIGKNRYVLVNEFAGSVDQLPLSPFTHELKATLSKGTEIILQNSFATALIEDTDIKIPCDCDIILLPATKLQQFNSCVCLELFEQQEAKIIKNLPEGYGECGIAGPPGVLGIAGDRYKPEKTLPYQGSVRIKIDSETILTKRIPDKFNKNSCTTKYTNLTLSKCFMTSEIQAGSVIKIGNNLYVVIFNFIDDIDDIAKVIDPEKKISLIIPEGTNIEQENGIIVKLADNLEVNLTSYAEIIIPANTSLQQIDTAVKFIVAKDQKAILITHKVIQNKN